MDESPPLLIVGASARAAAFSALRAGLTPWCADLFADTDLQARCATWRIPPEAYPQRLLRILAAELPGPWMYTGALENWPDLVGEMAEQRRLWGNVFMPLRRCRSPWAIQDLLRGARLPSLQVWGTGRRWLGREPSFSEPPRQVSWLRKPLASAAGSGVRRWKHGDSLRGYAKTFCLQQFVEGESCSAVYVGEVTATLVGVTRQLVGEPWLHARPFHYCGSLGPLRLDGLLRTTLCEIGNRLATWSRLHGLFGVDYVLHDGEPFTVEVNPRYTASVEVLEYASGVRAMAHHRGVFDPSAPMPGDTLPVEAADCVGKAILYARAPLVFPTCGPWLRELRSPRPVTELPGFADIPYAGEPIAAGRPVLTFFARARSEAACLDELRRIAADLDHHLFGR